MIYQVYQEEQEYLQIAMEVSYFVVDHAQGTNKVQNQSYNFQLKKQQVNKIGCPSSYLLNSFDIMKNNRQKNYTVEKIKQKLYVRSNFQEEHVSLHFLLQNFQDEIPTLLSSSGTFSNHLNEFNKKYNDQFRTGNQYLYGTSNEKNFDKAIKHYKQALNMLPDKIQSLNNLACALIQKNEFQEAKKILQKCIHVNGNTFEIYHNLGHVNFMIMKHSDAKKQLLKDVLKYYRKSLELNPQNYRAYHNIANLYIHKKQYSYAIQNYQNSLNICPSFPASICSLANAYKLTNQFSLSFSSYIDCFRYQKRYYHNLVGLANLLLSKLYSSQISCPQSINMFFFQEIVKNNSYFTLSQVEKLKCIERLYLQALKANPSSSIVFNGLGNVYLLFQRYSKALQFFKKSYSYNKNYFPAYNGAGLAYYYLGKYHQSLKNYQQSQSINGLSEIALLGKLNVFLKLNDKAGLNGIFNSFANPLVKNQIFYYYRAFISTYKQQVIQLGLSKSRNKISSLRIVANIMLQFKQYELARKYFQQIGKQDKNQNICYYIGKCYESQGETIKSIDYYLKSIQKDKNQHLSLYKIAQIYYAFNQISKSHAIIKKIASLQNNNIQILSLHASIMNKQQKYQEQIQILKEILNITNQSEDCYNNLAIAHLRHQNFHQSERYFLSGLQRNANNWIILNNIGNFYSYLKKQDQSKHYFSKLIRLNQPNFVSFINLGLCKQFSGTFDKYSFKNNLNSAFEISLFRLFQEKYDDFFTILFQILDCSHFNEINGKLVQNFLKFLRINYPFVKKFISLNLLALSSTQNNQISSKQYFSQLLEDFRINDGYLNATINLSQTIMKSVHEQQNLRKIYLLLLKQLFSIDEYQGIRFNHYLSKQYKSYQNDNQRLEMIFHYQSSASKNLVTFQKIVESIINNKIISSELQENIGNSRLKQIYENIQKVQKIKEIFSSNINHPQMLNILRNITGQKEEQSLQIGFSNILTLQLKKYPQFEANFSRIFKQIEDEEHSFSLNAQKQLKASTRGLDISQNSIKIQNLKNAFNNYYQNCFFTNLFIKYVYNSFIFYIQDPKIIATLKSKFEGMKNPKIIIASSFLKDDMKQILQSTGILSSLTITQKASSMNLSFEVIQHENFSSELPSLNYQYSLPLENTHISILQTSKSLQNERYMPQNEDNAEDKKAFTLEKQISAIETSDLTITMDGIEYSKLKKKILSQIQYSDFKIFFGKNLIQMTAYLKQKSFIYCLQPSCLLLKNQKVQSQIGLSIYDVAKKGQKEVINYILNLSKMMFELESLGLYHFNISQKNIIKIDDVFKLNDFEFALMIFPKKNSLFERTLQLFRSWLKFSQQVKVNIIKFIFKYCDNHWVQSIMAITHNIESQPQEQVDSLIVVLRRYANHYHHQQFVTIVYKFLDNNHHYHNFSQKELKLIMQYLNHLNSSQNSFQQSHSYLEDLCRTHFLKKS